MMKIDRFLLFVTLLINSIEGIAIMPNIKNIQYNENYDFEENVHNKYREMKFKNNLIYFIELNMDILTNKNKFDELKNRNDIELSFYSSKIISKPILKGEVDYMVIFSDATTYSKGKYFLYNSFLSRETKDQWWKSASIYGYYEEEDQYQDFGFFTDNEFKKLNLIFTGKILLKDLNKQKWLNYTSVGYKNLNDRAYNSIIKKSYAIYEFETIYNNHKLKLSFTVSKDKYMFNLNRDDLPYEWSQLFIERIN